MLYAPLLLRFRNGSYHKSEISDHLINQAIIVIAPDNCFNQFIFYNFGR